MLIETSHYTFTLDRNARETETMHRAVGQLVCERLNAHPEYIHRLDELVTDARRFVVCDEMECVVSTPFVFFDGGKRVTRARANPSQPSSAYESTPVAHALPAPAE